MKYFRIHTGLLLAALVVLVAVSLTQTRTGRGQSRGSANRKSTHVKTTSDVRRVRPSANPNIGTNNDSSLSPAVQSNLLFRNELSWTFGGKAQRGWYLYIPLIKRLIGTEQDATSNDFVLALSRWQRKAGLPSNGVLDENSLYAMVAQWQQARLKQRDYPAADQLFTAPISDFYDPSRPEELRQVEAETYAAYKQMIAAAAADRSLGLAVTANSELASGEKYLKIISAFRSREYQEHLRKQSPNAGRAGLAIISPHFTGRALDLYVGGEPVETKDTNRAIQIQTPVYLWLVRNAERFGFRPYYYEPWHWEYVR